MITLLTYGWFFQGLFTSRSRLRTVRVVRAGSVGLQIRQRGLRRRQIGHLRRNAKQVIKV